MAEYEINVTPEEVTKLLSLAEEAREMTHESFEQPDENEGDIMASGRLIQASELDTVIAFARYILGMERKGTESVIDELLEKGSEGFIRDRRDARVGMYRRIREFWEQEDVKRKKI